MVNLILLITLSLFCGCASPLSALISPAIYQPKSPYQSHEDELNALYSSGKISTEKYIELKQQLLIAKQEQTIQRASIPEKQNPVIKSTEQFNIEILNSINGNKDRVKTDCSINGSNISCR